MKRREIIKKLEQSGYVLKKHISSHDIYWNEAAKKTISIERHREINNTLATELLKEVQL
ncbi:MAG: type II toxin-antitoxin system HicA family toxin [Defluviitaleaceae bacterium]|nr:type II toxin-antitoxin system HicA family toxin [Defluviitaleaceae bacterium]